MKVGQRQNYNDERSKKENGLQKNKKNQKNT